MGSLALEARQKSGNWMPIWRRAGNQGKGWKAASVAIGHEVTALRFVGETGTSYRSDMALDAVSLST